MIELRKEEVTAIREQVYNVAISHSLDIPNHGLEPLVSLLAKMVAEERTNHQAEIQALIDEGLISAEDMMQFREYRAQIRAAIQTIYEHPEAMRELDFGLGKGEKR